MISLAMPDNPVERIRHNLVGLRMPRALEALEGVIQQLERGQLGAIEAIDVLLAEEITVREGRRIKAALQMARLATIKTLTGFDFSFQPSLDRNRIMALASLDFVDRHEVVHFIGQSGTGKSHLAVALGVEAIRAGRSVYFCPLADIIDSLAKADREGRLRERIRYLCRTQLLIIDEIGYVTLGAAAGNLFFQLVNARYERGAMILTSNRGFAEWGQVFGDPVIATALLDRLLHHAVVVHIEGSSYRMRQHADCCRRSHRAACARRPSRNAAVAHPKQRPTRCRLAEPSPRTPPVQRYVTEAIMPKNLPSDGSLALTNAERQARHRARKAEQANLPSAFAGLLIAAPDFSAGTTPWRSCSPCRPNTPPGPTGCQKPARHRHGRGAASHRRPRPVRPRRHPAATWIRARLNRNELGNFQSAHLGRIQPH